MGPEVGAAHSVNIRQLEARHADRLAPGTSTWEQSIKGLFGRMTKAGPVKGVKMLKQAADYLNGVDEDERAHLVLACGGKSRKAHLALASFVYGAHPDARVQEEGFSITLHIVQCSRSQPRCWVGIPVAYISRHALNRLYEHGDDIENNHVTAAIAYVAVLGYLAHYCERLFDSGLYLRFGDLLAAGAMHRFDKLWPDGRASEERIYDVRTVLPADEIGPARQHQLRQGELAAAAVTDWFENADSLDEETLVDAIPFLPRREDHYPVRATRSN